jgi:spermidine synthase
VAVAQLDSPGARQPTWQQRDLLMNLLWSVSVLVLGFVASAGQALLLRALLATFHGNELTLGIGLALWMTGTALGSLAAGRGWFGSRGNRSLAVAFLCASMAVLAAVAVGRVLGVVAGIQRGELAPLATAALGGAILFLPVTMVLGAVFTLACRAGSAAGAGAHAVGQAYMLDAAGATVGGAAVAFVLLPLCGPLQTATGLSVVCLAMALALFGAPKAAICVTGAGVLLALSPLPSSLDDNLVRISWPAYHVLDAKETPYQSLVVAEREGQLSLFADGAHLASFPGFEGAELLAHLPLLQNRSVADVLLIGGSVTGVLREVLRHDQVKHVDCVELDPWVTRLVLPWLPQSERAPLEDARVRVLHVDGRLWVQKARAGTYDATIMQLPDPYTTQINRFYTEHFFAQTARVLKPDGVLAFRVSSGENYISPLQERYLGTLVETVRSAFESVRMTPGEEAIILARAGPGGLTLRPGELLRRLNARGIAARYFSTSWLPFQLTDERLNAVADIGGQPVDVNTDFRPISYFYNVLLWSRRQGALLPNVLEKIERVRTWHVVLAGFASLAGLALVPRRTASCAAACCLLAAGAATITLQIVLLIAYQAISGYVYSRVSLFAAFFMAGLAVGAAIALKATRGRRVKPKRLLTVAQSALAAWSLVVAALLISMQHGLPRSGGLILCLALPTGVFGGFVFPLASAVRSTAQHRVERVAASSYALDLAGAAMGTVVSTVILVPVLGLAPACLFAASFSAGAALLLGITPIRPGAG